MSTKLKEGSQRVLRRLVILLAALGLALGTALGTASPAQASATVLLSGSVWLNGQGVNVCAPSTDPNCGNEAHVGGWAGNWWQCVELAQRLYQKRGWHSGIFANVSYAYQIYDQASALGMNRQANGSITSLAPGDMIVHGSNEPYSGGAGHVSIVDHVQGSTVYVVEQNTYGNQPRGTYNFANGTLTRAGSGTLRGVVHDPDNHSANTPPAPPAWGGVGSATFIGTDTLSAGQELRANQYMLSNNGLFVLMMQSDGNLVMYRSNGVIWASNTAGNAGAYLRVQSDGNVVIYKTQGGAALWSTGMKSISKLVMQGDGNLVGRSSSGAAKWATNTVRNTYNYTSQGSQLDVGESLSTYKFLRSPDKRYFALLQNDGNLVVYAPGYRVLWSSRTAGNTSAYLTVQSDGNAVIYQTVHGDDLWATGQKGITKVVMQSDGNFVAYDSSGDAVWATNTVGRL